MGKTRRLLAFALTLLTTLDQSQVPGKSAVGRPDLSGEYEMVWHGGKGVATFRKDGSYHCQWCSTDWDGTWHWNGDDLVVSETERVGGARVEWTVTFVAGSLKGTVDSGGEFSLKRR